MVSAQGKLPKLCDVTTVFINFPLTFPSIFPCRCSLPYRVLCFASCQASILLPDSPGRIALPAGTAHVRDVRCSRSSGGASGRLAAVAAQGGLHVVSTGSDSGGCGHVAVHVWTHHMWLYKCGHSNV